MICTGCHATAASGKFCMTCGEPLTTKPTATSTSASSPTGDTDDRGLKATEEQNKREEERMAKLFGLAAQGPAAVSKAVANKTLVAPKFTAEDVFKELNAARTAPAAFADRILTTLHTFRGKRQIVSGVGERETTDGIEAVDAAIAFLRRAGAREPLTFCEPLSHSARDLVLDAGPRGETNDTMSDGTTPSQRYTRYGAWRIRLFELFSYGALNAFDVVAQLIISDGESKKVDRTRLFDISCRVAGISVGPHSKYGNMAVLILAGDFDTNPSATPGILPTIAPVTPKVTPASTPAVTPTNPPTPTPTPTPTPSPPKSDTPKTISENAEAYWVEMDAPLGPESYTVFKKGSSIIVCTPDSRTGWQIPFYFPVGSLMPKISNGKLKAYIMKNKLAVEANIEKDQLVHTQSLPKIETTSAQVQVSVKQDGNSVVMGVTPCKFDGSVKLRLLQEDSVKTTVVLELSHTEPTATGERRVSYGQRLSLPFVTSGEQVTITPSGPGFSARVSPLPPKVADDDNEVQVTVTVE
ncbi:serine protease [Pelomyxa schiedti]|nr:serine protease [Pelomyxa schiedti]